MITKKCTKCNETKPLEAFYPQDTGRLGYRADCKKCCTIKVRLFRIKQRERKREMQSLQRIDV
jgi:hypothetical protein